MDYGHAYKFVSIELLLREFTIDVGKLNLQKLILWKLVTFLCDLPYNMANKAMTKRVVAEHAIEREEPKR